MTQELVNKGDLYIPLWDDGVTNSLAVVAHSAVTEMPPVAGQQMRFVSADAKDDLAGVGAQKVKLVYLDASFALLTEEIEMDGTTEVDTTDLDIARLLQCFVSQVGSEDDNAGAITMTHASTGGNTYIVMPAGANAWMPGRYTVPDGSAAHYLGGHFICGDIGSEHVDVTVWAEIDLDTGEYVDGLFNLIQSFTMSTEANVPVPRGAIMIPEHATVLVRAVASAAGPFTLAGGLHFFVG